MPVRTAEETINHVRSILLLKTVPSKGILPPEDVRGADSYDKIILNWHRCFDRICTAGRATPEELRRFLRKDLKISERACPDSDLKLLYERIDADGSGYVDFDEFLDFVKQKNEKDREVQETLSHAAHGVSVALRRRRVRSQEDLAEMFQNLDENGDNSLSLREFIKFIREEVKVSHHEVSDRQVKTLFRSMDEDDSGDVDVDEFYQFILDCVHTSIAEENGDGPKRRTRFGTKSCASAPALMLPALKQRGTEGQDGSSASPQKLAPRLPSLALMSGPVGRRNPHSLPAVQKSSNRSYAQITGAQRLNKMEDRLLDSGVNLKGRFFKASSDKNARMFAASRTMTSRFVEKSAEKAISLSVLEPYCLGG
eukprot:TRINITY_DN11259_c0_g1_i1.p1 TRINITY_DN11259_c0_g1~~TRINITY_DN11259_c0_g1_i1.p1  ORF type:complete len:368 (-),score=63.01 TRINITY_DN11259_c0_g1_i1:414-1517(-)